MRRHIIVTTPSIIEATPEVVEMLKPSAEIVADAIREMLRNIDPAAISEHAAERWEAADGLMRKAREILEGRE